MSRRLTLLATGAALLAAPLVMAAPPAPDDAALDHILREHGLGDKAQGGSWFSYVGYLLTRALGWVFARITRILTEIGDPGGWVGVLLWVLLALAVLALLAAVGSALLKRLRRRGAESGAAGRIEAGAAAPAAALFDAASWRQELDRLLAAGDLRGALEAVWWWLARSLAGAEADPSWTSSELLAHTGRRELAGSFRRLDQLTYGAAEPTADEIRQAAAVLAAELTR